VRTSVTIDDTVAFLNKLAELDSSCVYSLISNRVECNENIADYGYVQVYESENGNTLLGLLGVLNGLFQVGGSQWGTICMKIEKDTGRISFFKRETV
jgi:hypothetical protein